MYALISFESGEDNRRFTDVIVSINEKVKKGRAYYMVVVLGLSEEQSREFLTTFRY